MAGGSFEIVPLLKDMVAKGAADLHLQVGLMPAIRLNDELCFLETRELSVQDMEELFLQCAQEKVRADLQEKGAVDFAFSIPEARFRVCVCMASGEKRIVLRRIPHKILPIDSLGLPPQFLKLIFRMRGLLLVTGPTGSGKTTTLASLISYLAQKASRNIIMIEEPTEYRIKSTNRSIVTQREVGTDLHDFQSGLRTALRMDPNVIVVGEMRDPETVAMAIQAADTGHLVLGTLHTSSAYGTVDRIIGQVSSADMNFVRANLASNLLGVACQQLVKTKDGKGVVAASEIMLCNTAMSNLIRQGNLAQIPGTLETHLNHGMRRLDHHLAQLVVSGIISMDAGKEKSNDPNKFEQLVKTTKPPNNNDDDE